VDTVARRRIPADATTVGRDNAPLRGRGGQEGSCGRIFFSRAAVALPFHGGEKISMG
jgi:hypothetical protein